MNRELVVSHQNLTMNRVLTSILFSLLIIICNKGFTQSTKEDYNVIPKEFESQFKSDEQRYLEYTNPYLANTSKASDLWKAANKGYLKNYDIDSLYRAVSVLREKYLIRIIEFIKQNPGSYASLYYFKHSLLVSTKLNPDSLLKVYSLLSKDLRATPLGQNVVESLHRRQTLLLNFEMPDFSFKTDKGQVINLSSFKSQKHVLLCFWASWCGPCVRNFPYLKKIEEQYSSKELQIISISLDSDTANWLGAVAKYRLPWLQTCDLPAYISTSMRMQFQIDWIPTYFLINKEGKLVYQTFLSNDNDDHAELDKALHKELNNSQ
jgi:peroxiredoxin